MLFPLQVGIHRLIKYCVELMMSVKKSQFSESVHLPYLSSDERSACFWLFLERMLLLKIKQRFWMLSLHKLAVQQAAVGFNLHFQARLDVEKLLILRALALHVSPDLQQLRLQVPNLKLHL